MVRRSHQKVRDEIILNGLHPLDSLAAPVLGLEIVHGHPFDIAQIGHGDDGIVPGDHILHGNIVLVVADFASAVVPVFFFYDQDLFPDHAQQSLFIRKNGFQIRNLNQQFFMLRFQLFPLQTGEGAQTHVNDGLCLHIGQPEPLNQPFLGNLGRLAGTDNMDHFVDIVLGNEQALQDMVPLFRLVQIILRPPGDHIFLVADIILQHLQKV